MKPVKNKKPQIRYQKMEFSHVWIVPGVTYEDGEELWCDGSRFEINPRRRTKKYLVSNQKSDLSMKIDIPWSTFKRMRRAK